MSTKQTTIIDPDASLLRVAWKERDLDEECAVCDEPVGRVGTELVMDCGINVRIRVCPGCGDTVRIVVFDEQDNAIVKAYLTLAAELTSQNRDARGAAAVKDMRQRWNVLHPQTTKG